MFKSELQYLLDIINNASKLQISLLKQNHHNLIIVFHISMQLVLLSSQITQIYIVQCFRNIIVLFHIVNLD